MNEKNSVAQPSAAPIYQARTGQSLAWTDVSHDVYEFVEPQYRRIVYAAPTSDQQAGAVAAAWAYCPECGSEEIRYEEGGHKQCAICHQEWWTDVDYSDVVRKHLHEWKYGAAPAAIEQAGAQPAESGVVGWQNRMAPDQIVEGKNPPDASDKWVALVYAEQAGAQPVAWPTNDEVYAEVRRQRGSLPGYVSTNAVNDVMAAVRSLRAAPTPATDQDAALLDALEAHPSWELSQDTDPEELGWLVHKVVGSPNDREWREIGKGRTPREAIRAAIQAATPVTDQPKQENQQ
jgi:putative hemolysin